MKKLIMFGAALIMAVSFNSCTSKEESSTTTNNPSGGGSGTGGGNTSDNTQSQATRMVKRIIEDNNTINDFEYDAQGRIIRRQRTSTYSNSMTTTLYSYSGNTVTAKTEYGNDYEICKMRLNSDGYAEYFEDTDYYYGEGYYTSYTDVTYKNGYIQSYGLVWDDGGYMNGEYTWDNGNLAISYVRYNEYENPTPSTDIVEQWTYTYNLFKETVPVNIDFMAFVGLGDYYNRNCASFFGGKQSKNLPTKAEHSTIYLGNNGYNITTSYTLDYKFNSDGTISSITKQSSSFSNTYDITYY